ncbi:MAG: DNA repair protein RadC [Deltaproteobacteria bacterium]|nr:DNA repair protein RadC [Deltaproteobacteria bacterium]
MALKQWPACERPRERLARMGAKALGDAELVAIVLGTGVGAGGGVFELSMEILERLGGVEGLDAAPLASLTAIRGIGEAKAAVLKAACELGRRSLSSAASRRPVRRSRDLFEMFRARFHGADRELVVCAMFDTGLRPLGDELCSVGSASQCLVDTRLVLKEALVRGAGAIAVLHNHPSGDPAPSAEDRLLTIRLSDSASAVGLRFFDHLIVAGASYYSFADDGKIRTPN